MADLTYFETYSKFGVENILANKVLESVTFSLNEQPKKALNLFMGQIETKPQEPLTNIRTPEELKYEY